MRYQPKHRKPGRASTRPSDYVPRHRRDANEEDPFGPPPAIFDFLES